MSTSADRRRRVSDPTDWPPIVNSPSIPFTRPIGVTSSGVAVESVTPPCVSTEGGAFVTITGSGFVPGAVVAFGVADGTETVVRDEHTITVRVPASSGVSDAVITVTNPSLESGQLTDEFQYRWPDSACGKPRRRASGR